MSPACSWLMRNPCWQNSCRAMTELNLSICLPKYSLIFFVSWASQNNLCLNNSAQTECSPHSVCEYIQYNIMPKLEPVQTQLRSSMPPLPPAQKTVPIYALRVQTQKTSHTYACMHRCMYTKMMPISVEQDDLFPVCRDACIKKQLLSLSKEVEIRSRQKLLLAKEV